MTAGFLADPVGQAAVADILTRKRLAEELAAADGAYTAAVSAAAGGGDWRHARQAREVVKQAQSAFIAAGGRIDD